MQVHHDIAIDAATMVHPGLIAVQLHRPNAPIVFGVVNPSLVGRFALDTLVRSTLQTAVRTAHGGVRFTFKMVDGPTVTMTGTDARWLT